MPAFARVADGIFFPGELLASISMRLGQVNVFAGDPSCEMRIKVCMKPPFCVACMRVHHGLYLTLEALEPSQCAPMQVCRRFKHIVKLEQKLALCAKDCPAFMAALVRVAYI